MKKEYELLNNPAECEDLGMTLPQQLYDLKATMPPPKATLSVEPTCFSCSNVQGDVLRNFKLACLAYTPSPVVYRNIEFNRKQMLLFRKFLMG
jgi:hypothetical protein